MRNFILFILCWLVQVTAFGQQVPKPVGSFSSDTVKLGELLQYSLVLRHAATQEVILPDTSYNFAPFEFVRKDFYPTTTRGGISTDSAVYNIRTFETYPVQQLALPVYVLHDQDTLQVFSEAKSVAVQQMVKEVKEPLQVRAETSLATVEERFDWPVLLIWVVAGATFLSLIWFIFGQAIKTKYKLYRLRQDHTFFASRYNAHIDRFAKSGASQSIEKAISLWKNYLTKLERSAINSFTTKEIVEFYHDDEDVNTALRLCDKAIYGNLVNEPDTETNTALQELRKFAKSRYKLRREITRNARNKR